MGLLYLYTVDLQKQEENIFQFLHQNSHQHISKKTSMKRNGIKTFCVYVAISVTILIPSLIFFCFVCVCIFSLPCSFISVVRSAKNICIYIHVNDAEVGGFSKHGM